MNLVQYLLEQFFKEQWFNTLGMIITSIMLTLVQTNGISSIISKLITTLNENNKINTFNALKWFAIVSLGYLIIFHIYKIFQNKLLTIMRQWIRQQIVNALIMINNIELSDLNFTHMSAPINRLSNTIFNSINDFIAYLLPNIVFLLTTIIYLFYVNKKAGSVYLLGNIIIIYYLLFNVQSLLNYNYVYESSNVNTETNLQEILNNMEKIIARGTSDFEMKEFDTNVKIGTTAAYNFYSSTTLHSTIMRLIVIIIVCLVYWLLISQYYNNKLSLNVVLKFITILTLYNENMNVMIRQIPDMLEFIARSKSVLAQFDNMDLSYIDVINKKIPFQGLKIDNIKFENVTFKYKNSPEPIISNLNLEIRPRAGIIIGIRGKSGSGKSTLSKLILKMNKITSGKITINGKDLNEISEKEIRQTITYIDQRGKVFNKGIKYNTLYGCELGEECERRVSSVMRKGVVREIVSRVRKNESGSGVALGEKLSGGERQITNIISGLISESKVLILDEPTNALDGELKKGLLELIEEHKENKCIIIITHDKEVYKLFDETIWIGE